MIWFVLGLIAGFNIAVIVCIVALAFKPPVERFTKQVVSKFSKKGVVMEPEDEELNDWVSSLPENHESSQ